MYQKSLEGTAWANEQQMFAASVYHDGHCLQLRVFIIADHDAAKGFIWPEALC